MKSLKDILAVIVGILSIIGAIFYFYKFVTHPDGTAGGHTEGWIALGLASPAGDAGILLVVAHVYREAKHGEEVIRIISARQAEKREIRRYRAQALDEE